MKKIIFMLVAIMSLFVTMTACAGKKENKKTVRTESGTRTSSTHGGRTLVVYFSATGTTERVAKMIAKATGGELYRIQPKEEYTASDLDWTTPTSRCCRENDDPKSRPAIVKAKDNLDAYDIIYLGYPNWWNGAPRIVNTFVETYGLKGKTVIPFMTSGGSQIENSEKQLGTLYPEVNWKKGRLLNGASQGDVDKWVKGMKNAAN